MGLGVRVSSNADQVGSEVAPHGPSRTLLQTELEPQCAMSELLAVMDDPIATVTALFTTNVGCAMCLVPCASADDAVFCLMGCLKRDEGSCTEEDLAAIEASGMPSSLAGRAELVRMMEVTARGCVRCIAETIASVCGGDCVPERLHIVTDYAYNPRPCLPELAQRISAGEASAFERAVAANEPFGLVIGELPGLPKLSDLFVPLDGPPQQRKVCKGLDSGTLAYECDPAVDGRVWAISPPSSDAPPLDTPIPSVGTDSAGAVHRAGCSGALRIDLESGRAVLPPASADGSSHTPIRFDLQWADCATLLPSDSLGPSVSGKVLDGLPATRAAAACWLSRYLGPQTMWCGPPIFAIELSGESVTLHTDLVVRSGTTLRISSSRRTAIVIGPHQIRVESGARLELDGLTIADSVLSSALVVRGSAAATRCTFVRCSVTTNLILSGLMDTFVPDGVGATLAAGGGAVYVAPSAAMELVDSSLRECTAGGAKVAAMGGAVFVDSKAQLQVLRSELRRNSVSGGSNGAFAGAIYIYTSAQASPCASRPSSRI